MKICYRCQSRLKPEEKVVKRSEGKQRPQAVKEVRDEVVHACFYRSPLTPEPAAFDVKVHRVNDDVLEPQPKNPPP